MLHFRANLSPLSLYQLFTFTKQNFHHFAQKWILVDPKNFTIRWPLSLYAHCLNPLSCITAEVESRSWLITVNITCRLKFCGTWGIFLLNNLAWYFLPCGLVSKYNLFFTIYDSLFLPLCNFLSRKGVITGWYQSEILSRTSLHKAGNSKFHEPAGYTYRY